MCDSRRLTQQIYAGVCEPDFDARLLTKLTRLENRKSLRPFAPCSCTHSRKAGRNSLKERLRPSGSCENQGRSTSERSAAAKRNTPWRAA